MEEELNRPELIHDSPFMTDEAFLQAIDSTGGWPNGFQFVSFFHAAEYKGRTCKFTNTRLNTGWWTTVASSDDYHWWKLSPERKAKELQEARRQLIAQLR